MKKNIHITHKDYYKFSRYASKRATTPETRRAKRIVVYIILIILVSILLLAGTYNTESWVQDFKFVKDFHRPTAIFILIPFFFITLSYLNLILQSQKSAKPSKAGLVIGDHEIEFLDEKISDITPLGTSFHRWEAVEDIVVHKGNVYVFLDTMLAYILPKSSFSSKKEIQDLSEYLRQNIEIASTSPDIVTEKMKKLKESADFLQEFEKED